MQLTFYGGCGVVGGNKILLEDAEKKLTLFLDFGLDFKALGDYYAEFLQPRTSKFGLLDPIEMGLLPPIDGIYRSDLVLDAQDLHRRMARSPFYRRISRPDAVVVTHAHLDHLGSVAFLDPEIPVVSTAMTAMIGKAVQDTGMAGQVEREVCLMSPRQNMNGILEPDKSAAVQRKFIISDAAGSSDSPAASAPSAELRGRCSAGGASVFGLRATEFWARSPWKNKTVTSSEPGDMKKHFKDLLRCYNVDHSIYGASAWAIDTSAGWVVYTGDLRLHGSRGALTEKFIEAAAKLKPAALITEGTQAGSAHASRTEEEVALNAREAVRREKNLVIADFQPRHIERLAAFLKIANTVGRKLVVLPRDVYLLEAMHSVDDSIPTPGTSRDMMIYQPAKSRADGWEEYIWSLYPNSFVGPQAIHDQPGKFILCMSFFDLKELPSIMPGGGTYIYSTSEAYDEEQKVDLQRLRNWLTHFNMIPRGFPTREVAGKGVRFDPKEEGFHASGHIGAKELAGLISRIGPKYLIPVHTENPQWFLSNAGDAKVLIPELGKPIVIGRG